MSRKVLSAFGAIALLIALGLWLKNPRKQTTSATDFSAWSRSVASPAPARPFAAPDRMPQNETTRPTWSRSKIDPALVLNRRRGTAASTFTPSATASETLKNLPREALKPMNAHRYQVLGAWAVPREDYSASMGEVLQEQNNYAVIPLDESAGETWKDMTVRPEARPVLISPDNGRLSVVTGTLVVQLKDLERAGAIADSENLQVLSVDESIQTVYYKAPVGYGLLSGLKRLQASKDVAQVELELDQGHKVGK